MNFLCMWFRNPQQHRLQLFFCSDQFSLNFPLSFVVWQISIFLASPKRQQRSEADVLSKLRGNTTVFYIKLWVWKNEFHSVVCHHSPNGNKKCLCSIRLWIDDIFFYQIIINNIKNERIDHTFYSDSLHSDCDPCDQHHEISSSM